ncbi:MAG TPA: hypothetical protein PLY93_08010 [Turneriella sp.]|nr:hypothetical protein [Turneriella sp.]
MHETIEAQFQNALAHAQMATLQSLSPLVPEASTRRYFRLFLEDDSTCVGVFENPETAKKTMPRVVAVQRFLENGGIAVPRIYFTDTHAGVMLQQDLGDVSLNTALKAHPKKTDSKYVRLATPQRRRRMPRVSSRIRRAKTHVRVRFLY